MPLYIKDEHTHELARELAVLTGETMTNAVKHALQDKLRLVQQKRSTNSLADALDQIALYCAALPQNDNSNSNDIIGYDKYGLTQ
ncbi:MAG: type II toxin-antitoxin system VapB family antitoxin [Paracoccaceae bacterium]|nr:type II toxin-antitoxin system VapB family antitoxin [Paracoccaceae bacterium]MDE2917570.1 type II toxin-antitoxin system VapB family antitoxin [Paracoccaceae bacterium]